MDPLTMSLLAGAGTAIGALPDIIPSKYERDQRKRLREMQRKQEMGALGLTEQQRAAIEGQMRGARQQAQQYAEAERARLTQPTAQPQMALLGQQMQDESRQRLEADLASQILNMDLARQAQQEQEIKDLEAAQAQYRRARAEGLTAPFQAGAEAYVGQMGLERMLSGMSPEQRQRYIDMQFMQRLGQGAQSMRQGMANAFAPGGREISIREAMSMNRPIESYSYQDLVDAGLNAGEIDRYFRETYENRPIDYGLGLDYTGVKASDLEGRSAGIYGGERR
jgi:hypothetical protein